MSIRARFVVDRGDFRLDVDLGVPSRGVTSLFGPSGCGKTTLLRAITGLDRHPDGYLRFGDETWQDGAFFLPPHRRPRGACPAPAVEPRAHPRGGARGHPRPGARRGRRDFFVCHRGNRCKRKEQVGWEIKFVPCSAVMFAGVRV